MTTITPIPSFRDLPPARLAELRQHLLTEIGRQEDRRGRWSPLRPFGLNRRSHQRRLVVVVVAALLGTFVATPAFGVRGALLDLLGRSDVPFAGAPPAASVIKRQFADMSSGAPKGMDPRVSSGEARLAATFEVGGLHRQVWVAPTKTGGFCYLIEGISGGCTEVRSDPIVLDGSFFVRPGSTAPTIEFLAGRIYAPHAAQLRVAFEDGTTKILPFVYVSDPIAAGFFAYKATRAQEQAGHRPLEVLIVNSSGTEIGRETINWANEEQKLKHLRDVLPPKPTSGARP